MFRKSPQGRLTTGLVLTAVAVLWLVPAAAARGEGGIIGRWLTANHHAVVEIGHCGADICGRLDWLYRPIRHGAPARDENNPDQSRRGRPLCGLVMLYDFKPDPSNPRHWRGGYIYDPETGDTYHAEMTLVDPAHLHLRGYVGIPLFGETQTWTRIKANYPICHLP
ncbi:MAG: DUF2147 domain-containing protein [Stellaceae bacterium]